MEPETLVKTTEPFFTTKGVGRGTGLGLPMVSGMAEQCGGRLVLHSARGLGTTAEIWLPVAQQGSESVAVPPEPDASFPETPPLTILAVDDDEIVLVNTVAILSDMGHEVLRAESGREALDILGHRDCDLILTDYAMPGLNRQELLAAARQSRPGIPALLLTGYADVQADDSLTDARLSKPFTAQQLAEAIAGLFAGAGRAG